MSFASMTHDPALPFSIRCSLTISNHFLFGLALQLFPCTSDFISQYQKQCTNQLCMLKITSALELILVALHVYYIVLFRRRAIAKCSTHTSFLFYHRSYRQFIYMYSVVIPLSRPSCCRQQNIFDDDYVPSHFTCYALSECLRYMCIFFTQPLGGCTNITTTLAREDGFRGRRWLNKITPLRHLM